MNAAQGGMPTPWMNKVPEITLYFWIIKIMATTVGETAADFLAVDLHFGLSMTSAVMAALLLGFLTLQLRSTRYVPWLYWTTVVLVSVVGTLITDNLVDHLGVRLETATLAFGAGLLVTFAVWYAVERTLSIQTICTPRRELFYWAAILLTFALGTAAGDLSAESLGLGYAYSAAACGALILMVAAARYGLGMNSVIAFWLAYILTRPFGASFGDLLSKSAAEGGVGLGATGTSALFFAVIAALVVYLTVSGRDAQRSAADLR